MHILLDSYLTLRRAEVTSQQRQAISPLSHMLCLMLLTILSGKNSLCDTGLVLFLFSLLFLAVAVAGSFQHLVICP